MSEKKRIRKRTAATFEGDAQAKATTPKAAKTKKSKAKAEGKMSALDAAAKVLAEEGRPMSAKELIEAMAVKGYWTSPGGKTPEATLSAALGNEINKKGDASRFAKPALFRRAFFFETSRSLQPARQVNAVVSRRVCCIPPRELPPMWEAGIHLPGRGLHQRRP